jgi:hypothetical protein
LQARLRNLPDPTVQATRQVPVTFNAAARDRADLKRLQDEATMLQEKIAEFSAQARQLAATSPALKPSGAPKAQVLRVRDAQDAGQATPAATIQTFIWATLHGDTNRIAQLFVTEPGADPKLVQQGLEYVVSQIVENAATLLTNNLEMRLLEEQPGPNNDRWVVVQATQTDGAVQTERTLFRPSDTGWSLVLGTNGDSVSEQITNRP